MTSKLTQDPNEMRGDNVEVKSETACVRCGLLKEDWSGNHGKGVQAAHGMYCCKGCATDQGCTCVKK